VVRPAKYIGSELTTPSARNKVASRLLVDRAATPPLRGGECLVAQSLSKIETAEYDALSKVIYEKGSVYFATRSAGPTRIR
jgi:hypothetical protein